jgi:hypothetical protein
MGLNNLIFWILDLRFIVFVLAFVGFEDNFSLHSSFLNGSIYLPHKTIKHPYRQQI